MSCKYKDCGWCFHPDNKNVNTACNDEKICVMAPDTQSYIITEVDKDYNRVSARYYAGFVDDESAKAYCQDLNWTGHTYIWEKLK